MFYDDFNSPIGIITVSTDGVHITSLHIEGDRYFKGVLKEWTRDPGQRLLHQVHQELDEYFAGIRTGFAVPLLPTGTALQQAVWKALRDIPSGTTTSYKKIAQTIGKPQAVRTVASVIGRNPIGIIIPCHRVLTSTGSLGGYVAGLKRKQQLLDIEQSVHSA
jgi:methylated-DNA-[protein]-cysteine S-methyltransferase